MNGTLDLAAKFDGATEEAWRAAARKALGDAVESALGTRRDWPLTNASGLPGRAPYTRGTKIARARWDIRTLISETSPSLAAAQAQEDIAGGASSIWIDTRPFGDPASALAFVVSGVQQSGIALALDRASVATARTVLQTAGEAKLFLGLDHFAAMARGVGTLSDLAGMITLAREAVLNHPNTRAISIDGRVYHNAGATPAQELAGVLASGVGYLRALASAGVSIRDAASQLAFILVSDANFVTSIAKLRAFRRCWANVLKACGASEAMLDMHVAAVSSALMMTRHDAHTNILRTALAGFAAAVAGADAIALSPFDVRLGSASAEARRIARNTQNILLEEVNAARVIDPSGGAFAIERATEELAQAAWREFQTIEAQGGMAETLSNGFIARKISSGWETRRKRISTRTEWITGISDFPLLGEPVPLPPTPENAACNGKTLGLLSRHYLDDDFETMRAASDAYYKAHGARPKIYLVAIGSEIESGPRVAFARSLFEAGGIETVTSVSTGDAQSAAAAYLDSGVPLAALCSSDAVYSERALAYAHEIARSGARYLYLIGAARDLEPALREAGVDEFVTEEVDAAELLRRALETFGIAS